MQVQVIGLSPVGVDEFGVSGYGGKDFGDGLLLQKLHRRSKAKHHLYLH